MTPLVIIFVTSLMETDHAMNIGMELIAPYFADHMTVTWAITPATQSPAEKFV